jgi:hypothetical protein
MLKELLSSKKFQATLAAIVIAAAGRFGFNLSLEDLALPVGALVAFIIAQGWADFGKSAAQERTKALAQVGGLAQPVAGSEVETGKFPREEGFADATAVAVLSILTAIFVLFVVLFAGCVGAQQAAKGAARTAYGCAGDAVKAKVTASLPTVSDVLNSDFPEWRTYLRGKALELGGQLFTCTLDAVAKAAGEMRGFVAMEPPGAEKARTYLAEQGLSVE